MFLLCYYSLESAVVAYLVEKCGNKFGISLTYSNFDFVESRLHLGNKNKKVVFCFVFHSVCTTFAGKKLRVCEK